MSSLSEILKRLGPSQVGDKMTWVGNNYSKDDLRTDLQALEEEGKRCSYCGRVKETELVCEECLSSDEGN